MRAIAAFLVALTTLGGCPSNDAHDRLGAGGPTIFPQPGRISGALIRSGTISPTAICGTIHNYAPAGLAAASNLSQDASCDSVIDGFESDLPVGTWFRFHNISTHRISFPTGGASTVPIGLAGYASRTLTAGSNADVFYNGSTWFVVPLDSADLIAFQGGWQSTRYYFTANATAVTTSGALGVGTLRCAPWPIPNAVTLSRIGAEIQGAGEAGSKLRLCVYTDDGSARPGSLIVDAGQIDGTVTGNSQEIAISTVVAPQLAWWCGAVQNVTVTQPTVRTLSSGGAISYTDIGNAMPAAGVINAFGRQMTGVTNTCPSTWIDGGGTQIQSTPRLFVKVL